MCTNIYIYIGLLYTKAKCSICKVVPDVSFLPIFVPVALAPPRLFRAHPHAFQYETLGLHHVEEQLADRSCGRLTINVQMDKSKS